MRSSFDESENLEHKDVLPPLWSVPDYKNPTTLLKWCRETKRTLHDGARHRVATQKNNVFWFTGEIDLTLEYLFVKNKREQFTLPSLAAGPVFSHISEITEQRVSILSKFKPAFNIQPANSGEYKDRQKAKLMKIILDGVKRQNGTDNLMQELERWNGVFGEVYLSVEWDPKAGDRVTTEVDELTGEEISVSEYKKNGDVVLKLIDPTHVFPWPRRQWRDVPCLLDLYGVYHFEEVRKRWKDRPMKGIDIKQDEARSLYEFDSNSKDKLEQEVAVWRYIYKPDEFLPDGGEVIFTENCILEANFDKYKYSHNDFPHERYTDIDVMGRLHGMSFYQYLKPIQQVYNKTTSAIVRNHFLCGNPKWVYTQGGINPDDITNSPGKLAYRLGHPAPQLVSYSTTPPEMYEQRKEYIAEMEQISGIHGVSRGDPPAGLRSGIALSFLEDQEVQGFATRIVKRNSLITGVFTKAATVVSDYYPVNGRERIIKAVGKNNEYLLQALDDADIAGRWDTIVENTTALSGSTSGKTQRLLDIRSLPDGSGVRLVPDEMFIDQLELGSVEKFYDVATASLRAAESENRDILDGRPVAPPEPYEDHFVHWRTHMIEIQARSFKEDTPPEVRQAMALHIGAHEMLMKDLALKNTAAQQQLFAVTNYPAFFETDNLVPMLPMAPGGGGPGMMSSEPPVDETMTGEPVLPGEMPPAASPPEGQLPPGIM